MVLIPLQRYPYRYSIQKEIYVRVRGEEGETDITIIIVV